MLDARDYLDTSLQLGSVVVNITLFRGDDAPVDSKTDSYLFNPPAWG